MPDPRPQRQPPRSTRCWLLVEVRSFPNSRPNELPKSDISLPGSAGLTVAQQIYNRFEAAGKPLNRGDIAIVDGAKNHYYQVSNITIVERILFSP